MLGNASFTHGEPGDGRHVSIFQHPCPSCSPSRSARCYILGIEISIFVTKVYLLLSLSGLLRFPPTVEREDADLQEAHFIYYDLIYRICFTPLVETPEVTLLYLSLYVAWRTYRKVKAVNQRDIVSVFSLRNATFVTFDLKA